MSNWRVVSPWMTEDEAWNELADLEMLGIHYNLDEGNKMDNFYCEFCAGVGYRDYPSCKEPCPVVGHVERHEENVRGVAHRANLMKGPEFRKAREQLEPELQTRREIIEEYADYAKNVLGIV